MDRAQRKKYDKKSYKDFDVNVLNRRSPKQGGYAEDDLKDAKGNWIIRHTKKYKNMGYVHATVKNEQGGHFGKGPEDKFFKADRVKQRVASHTVGKKRTLPGPG